MEKFRESWGVPDNTPPWLFLQQDELHEGGAKTKNKACRRAVEAQCDLVVALDDDCFPQTPGQTLPDFCRLHAEALKPQPVRMFAVVTDPPSRGTPYLSRDLEMPVAASMGFWTNVGDYCAPRQLAFGADHPMTFRREAVFGSYFPLCAMNYAFKPDGWDPWYYLVEGVGRFDDIWMGWLWQKEAYARNCCFNLGGPLVFHSRQSNVWRNLTSEEKHLETNETLWQKIAQSDCRSYEELRSLLPITKKVHHVDP
jgi:hypothetical protein